MPNKNYISGRAKEYKIKKAMEKEGYTCIRASGSHGFCDIVAINSKEGHIRFIQAKPKTMPLKQKERLLEANKHFNRDYAGEYEVQ